MKFRMMLQSDIKKCPSFILWPPHYREDGSCRHDEPICEEDGCTNKKYRKEIFCKKHVEMMGGKFRFSSGNEYVYIDETEFVEDVI